MFHDDVIFVHEVDLEKVTMNVHECICVLVKSEVQLLSTQFQNKIQGGIRHAPPSVLAQHSVKVLIGFLAGFFICFVSFRFISHRFASLRFDFT